MMRFWLFEDIGWKLFCLAAAVFLWATFSGAQEITTSISAPVQYRNIPRNLDISSEMVEQVHLHLRGPSPQLSRLGPSALPIIIDLAKSKSPGERTFTLEAANLNLPAGVSLERAVPAQIRVRLETRISRSVQVEVRTQGLPAGLKIVRQETEPDQLSILGPDSRVARIRRVETDPIDLSGASAGESEYKVHVFAGDPQVNFATQPIVKVKLTLTSALN
jgi:YbbR domain-containing protein